MPSEMKQSTGLFRCSAAQNYGNVNQSFDGIGTEEEEGMRGQWKETGLDDYSNDSVS